MRLRLRWLSPALGDLAAIHGEIAKSSPASAKKVVTKIDRRARQLRRFPFMGRVGDARNTRQFIVPGLPYLIIYRVSEDTIDILGVMHGARNWAEYFDR